MTFISDPSVSGEAAAFLRQHDLAAPQRDATNRFVQLIGGTGLLFSGPGVLLQELPAGFHVESYFRTFPGVSPVALIEITDRGAGR